MELTQVGKFKIVEKLGQGAMGEVFRALDPVLGREVAIKVVTGKLSEDERARDRFQREAQSAAQLNHPNIITVYDFGEEQGMAYMAMELLEGQDLRELLAKGTLTGLDDKLAIMEQILDGLAFAHAKGVVHRDLKPGNVHVLPNGQIKVMDFGLARRARGRGGDGRHHGHAVLHGAGAGPGASGRRRGPTSSRWARCSTRCSPGSARSPAPPSPPSCSRSPTASRCRSRRWRPTSRPASRRW